MPAAKLYTLNALADELGHDRRSLKKWLATVPPAGRRNGNPVYRLADVERIIAAHVSKRDSARNAREKLTLLQAEKIAAQIRILKGEWVSRDDVRQWGAELGHAVKATVETLHLEAPSLAGLEVPQLAARLREIEADILRQLHGLNERLARNEPGRSLTVPHTGDDVET
ncbi:MAG: hypothetical protein ACK45B_05225 [Limisphaerales bacterium]